MKENSDQETQYRHDPDRFKISSEQGLTFVGDKFELKKSASVQTDKVAQAYLEKEASDDTDISQRVINDLLLSTENYSEIKEAFGIEEPGEVKEASDTTAETKEAEEFMERNQETFEKVGDLMAMDAVCRQVTGEGLALEKMAAKKKPYKKRGYVPTASRRIEQLVAQGMSPDAATIAYNKEVAMRRKHTAVKPKILGTAGREYGAIARGGLKGGGLVARLATFPLRRPLSTGILGLGAGAGMLGYAKLREALGSKSYA